MHQSVGNENDQRYLRVLSNQSQIVGASHLCCARHTSVIVLQDVCETGRDSRRFIRPRWPVPRAHVVRRVVVTRTAKLRSPWPPLRPKHRRVPQVRPCCGRFENVDLAARAVCRLRYLPVPRREAEQFDDGHECISFPGRRARWIRCRRLCSKHSEKPSIRIP